MASKFMAFENVASTSAEGVNTQVTYDDENERIEMNVNQYPSYQSYQSNHTAPVEPSPYGAVDGEEDDLNESFEEKTDNNVGYRKFIYNNSEQFKSICGGLLLMMGSGIHIVWGIYRLFKLYQCKEENSFYLRFVIWSWYIGAIIGNISAGFCVATIRKRHLYLIGGSLLIVSGVFMALSEAESNIYLLVSRVIAGFTQGLSYITVVVHVSENATKEFREFLMLIVGAVMNYSILISVLGFFHTEGLFTTSILNGLGLFTFGICTMIITAKHATETIPFLLQNNGSEMDALQTMSKLKKKPIAARSVHHDFLILKNLVQDEMDYYGKAEFSKVLLAENRKSFMFCCYGRLCSVLSFNLPLIVMIMLFLRGWADESVQAHGIFVDDQCRSDFWMEANSSEYAVDRKPINVEKEIEITEPIHRLRKRDATEPKTEIEKPKSMQDEKVEAEKDKINKEKANAKNDQENDKAKESAAKSKEIKGEEDKKIAKEENKSEKNEPNDRATNEQKEKGQHKSKEQVKTEAKESKASEKEKQMHRNNKEKNNRNGQNEKNAESTKEKNEKGEADKKPIEKEKSSPKIMEKTFFAHLIIFLHSRELTLILLAWFIFGTLTVAILYTLNLKRFIYYIACVLSSALAITGIAHSFHMLSGILHFCLIVYFNYVTIPIDVFGHCMLAEAFPITLKAFSIAAVAIVEHSVHILVIGLYMSEWFHDAIILFMCIVAFIAHEIARNLPQKSNLSLAEAREQYQHVDLMLFNEPKIGYQQQQQQQQQQQDFI